MTKNPCSRKKASRWAASILAVAFGSVSTALLYGAFCHFTGKAWPLADYGRYVNAIYNSAHGHLLRFAMEENYLSTHLSFTLALLGPLYLIWDHILLLVLVQWALLIGGSLLLYRAVRAQGSPAWMALSLCLFYAGYALMQSVMLMDFHGVCLYLLLIPWLYHALTRQRHMIWLPLVLLLGLREDAFLMALPMLLYFSVRDRWKPGYGYAIFSLVYGLAAVFILYPLINGVSLFERRAEEVSSSALTWFLEWETVKPRLVSLFWIGLPLIPFLLKNWRPTVIFMSIPVLATLFSGFKAQQDLVYHYPAIIMATMCCGMAETWAQAQRGKTIPVWKSPALAALYLILVLGFAHFSHGLLWGGGRHLPLFTTVHGRGIRLLKSLPHIPKQGVLLCTRTMAGACANRIDLWTWWQFTKNPDAYPPDIIFCSLTDLKGPLKTYCSEVLESGTFGVHFQNGEFFVFVRGADTSSNQDIIDLAERESNTMYLSLTHNRSGANHSNSRGHAVRSWEGADDARPRLLSFGKGIALEAGTYQAEIFYEQTGETPDDAEPLLHWSLHPLSRSRILAESDLFAHPPTRGSYLNAVLPFRLEEPARVEARIKGFRTPVSLFKVVYRLQEDDGAP